MERFPELDDALQDASEAVGLRLAVIDQLSRVVAYSIHETAADRARLSYALAHSDTWEIPDTRGQDWDRRELPVLGSTVFHRLLGPDRHTVGHLVITDSRDADGDQVFEVAERLGLLLAESQGAREARQDESRDMVAALIEGDPEERRAAAAALVDRRFLSASERYCAVALGVPGQGEGASTDRRAAAAAHLTVRFVNDVSTATVVSGELSDGLGVLVFPRPVVVERLTRILLRPDVLGVRAGTGPLTALGEVHTSYARARLAWRATCLALEDHPPVLPWAQAGLDGLLARLPLESFAMTDLPVSVAGLLDAGLHPEVMRTLLRYLECGGDAARTAKAMAIHRSTLYYRLDKVAKVLDGNLASGELRTELHVGLRTAQLAGLMA